MASESWFVDGGWACHCGPVPPYPADYPGPCRQCFALAPVKQKIDPAQRVRDAEAGVVAASEALHAWYTGHGDGGTIASHLQRVYRSVDALHAARQGVQDGE
jgi:hypothetical protein